MLFPTRATAVASLVLLAGCGATASDPASPDTAAASDGSITQDAAAEVATPDASVTGPTWHGAVRGLLEVHCNSCHVAGGVAPFVLNDYGIATQYSALIKVDVTSRKMPPWMPSADCRRYQDERLLTEAEIATIAAWVDAGAPMGNPAEYVAPKLKPDPLAALGKADVSLAAKEAYTPSATLKDDYRCFPLDHTFTQETWIRASTVTPDKRPIVHHVIVFLVDAALSTQLDAKDAAEAGPGYTCFGGPGVGSPQTLGGWVPGSIPNVLPDGTAQRIPPGARLVMQIHYNTMNSKPEADQTRAEFWFAKSQPTTLLNIRPLAHLGLKIPAGETQSLQSKTFKNSTQSDWLIVGATPHMHKLGSVIKATAVHADGKEECLVHVPKWDFGWQQSYRFLADQPMTVKPGESIRLECTYDNSPANQSWVEGKQVSPKEVTWGEGTLDEMCLNYIAIAAPYTPLALPTEQCKDVQPCYDACRKSTGGTMTSCVLQCAPKSKGCSECVLGSMVQCVMGSCDTVTYPLVTCLSDCQGEANVQACFASKCLTLLAPFEACAAPIVDAGQCDSATAGCNVKLSVTK